MKQEDKELLLKDLCARLPYGVKISVPELWTNELNCEELDEIFKGDDSLFRVNSGGIPIEYVKPYLFPLSNITEEQWNTAPTVNLTEFTFESLKCGCFTLASYTCENELYNLLEFINWLIENHFDIYGLIPMGLAIDATGLNIY